MDTMVRIINSLPARGWAVIEAHPAVVAYLVLDGYIKAQYTPVPNVFQARLTGKGRSYRE